MTNQIEIIDRNLDAKTGLSIERYAAEPPFTITCTDIEQKLIDPNGSIDLSNTMDWSTTLRIDDPWTRAAALGLAACGQPEQEGGRAEIAVGQQQILRFEPLQQSRQQGPFRGVTVRARQHVYRQHQRRIEHDHGMSRQRRNILRPQFLQTPLGCRQVIAIRDQRAKTGQQLRQGSARLTNNRLHPLGRFANQGPRYMRFDPPQLVVQSGQRDWNDSARA